MALNVKLLQESFEAVKPIAAQVVEHFYQQLFGKYPETKKLFQGTNMSMQGEALIKSLVTIVDNLENPERLTQYLRGLGRRHDNYNVHTEHYNMVGESLLGTFAYFFKEQWTPELQKAWADAYGAIVGIMLEAYPTKKLSTVQDSELDAIAKQLARKILLQALDTQTNAEFIKMAQDKANEMLTQSLKIEADKVFMNLKKDSNAA